MKKKQFFYPFMWIMLLQTVVVSNLYAQLSMERQAQEVVLPNTQTYDFIKHGTIGASLYTGTVNYSVPVYTYKDKDFELPVSLDYASNGYKPNSRGGDVGVGWTLNVGGCITREVKGIPDEQIEETTPALGEGLHIRGFYIRSQASWPEDEDLLKLAVGNDGKVFFYEKAPQSNIPYETEPDLFYYNFAGHTGKFYFWNDGKVKIYPSAPGDYLTVEITEQMNTILKITVKTADGYEYTFGSSGGNEFQYDGKNTPYTWKLSGIKAPNGREICFTYDKPQGYIGSTYNYQPSSVFAYDIFNNLQTPALYDVKKTAVTRMYSLPLSKITVSDGPVIDFNYVNTQGELYYDYYSVTKVRDAGVTPKLKKITVQYGEQNLATCDLTYKTYKNPSYSLIRQNAVYFLESVHVAGTGTYEFAYYNAAEGGFPALGSFSVDHWGYYNAKNDVDLPYNFMLELSYNTDFTENIPLGSVREANYSCALMGMLKQIKYPPGGYSDIEYEPHAYGTMVKRDASSAFLPYLSSNLQGTHAAGGVRVKSIKSYDTDHTLWDSKSYIYVNAEGVSSGILLNLPRYGIQYYAVKAAYNKTVKYYSLYDLYKYDKTHIEYTTVTQVNQDASKVVYHYTNYNDYPDMVYFATGGGASIPTIYPEPGVYIPVYFDIPSPYAANVLNILSPLTSFQDKRGRLKRQEVYSPDKLIRKTENQYADFHIHTFQIPVIVSEFYRMVEQEYSCFWQTDSETTDYFENDTTATSESYAYNNVGLTSAVSKLNSKGDQEITRYTYATDHSGSAGIYTTMISRNLLNYPVSVETFYHPSGGSGIQTGKALYAYSLFNNIVKTSSIHTYDINNKRYLLETTFNSYDSKGNLTQSTDANGIPTSYIWGYNGLYLVAKGENITYSALSAQVGASSTLPAGITASHATVAANCPDARIEFYEYKPIVGLSKHIDPSGKILNYAYNLSGKLKAITDQNGKLQKEYLYSPDNKQQ